MATMQDFLDRVYQLNDDFGFYHTKSAPATLAQVQEFERQFEIKLSSQVVEFLCHFGTCIIEVNDKVWQRPKEFEIVPAWKFGYGFYVHGLFNNTDNPKWLSFNENFDKNLNALIIFKRTGGLYRAYLGQNNHIYIAYENGADWSDMELFDGDFFDFLIQEINYLEKDYYHYLAEKN